MSRLYTVLVVLALILSVSCSKSPENESSKKDSSDDPSVTAKAATGVKLEKLIQLYERSNVSYKSYHQQELNYWASYRKPEQEKEPDPQDFESYMKQHDQAFKQYEKEHEEAWKAYAEKHWEEYKKFVKGVEAKWGNYRGSTNKEWVEYAGDKESRSYVDFENGYAVVETVVPAGANAKEMAAEKLKKMASTLLKITNSPKAILEGQIGDPNAFVSAAGDPLSNGSTIGKDGTPREKFVVAVPLVEDHLQKRAEKYLPYAEKYAKQFKMDKALILAVMETESSFNPRAKSWANAYGLMQIVPKFAGRESWRFIYKEDGIPEPDYLFEAENNVKHGSCYLHLLSHKYWKKIEKGNKRDFLVICAYNCGSANVKQMALSKSDTPVKDMTEAQLYELLAAYTPEETQGYLKKVTERRKLWKNTLNL